jgi:hypothetical protein
MEDQDERTEQVENDDSSYEDSSSSFADQCDDAVFGWGEDE